MADWNCNLCKEYQSGTACTFCDDGSKFNKMSNADKIRSMTDEELADWIYGIDEFWDDGECKKYINGVTLHDGNEDILQWLQSEAE